MTHTQAWCWHAPGEPDQLTLTRQALPTPGPDEVLVANRIIAFNPVDWKLIEQGHPHWQPGHVPGVDGMGTLVTLGANVTHLRPGTRVAYHTDLHHGGSFARHTLVPARALMPVPDALSDEAAAAAELHRESIETFYDCSHEFQTKLAQMYLADPRFTKTYDDVRPGMAQYVHDAIHANAARHD